MKLPEDYQEKYTEKECSVCKKVLEIDLFYIRKRKEGGKVYFSRYSRCIKCCSNYYSENYYQKKYKALSKQFQQIKEKYATI